MTKWTSKPTGNMTLSVLDDRNEQILKVDMLRHGTLKAGTNGDILVRTANDLALIAALPEITEMHSVDIAVGLPHADGGLSPLPWSLDFRAVKRLLVVRDAAGKRIAERTFPLSWRPEDIERVLITLRSGLAVLNARNRS